MDAMVTARMPQGKKEAGAEVLRSLGTTSSRVINKLFDYLIARRELPLGLVDDARQDRDSRIREALELIDGISFAGLGTAEGGPR